MTNTRLMFFQVYVLGGRVAWVYGNCDLTYTIFPTHLSAPRPPRTRLMMCDISI